VIEIVLIRRKLQKLVMIVQRNMVMNLVKGVYVGPALLRIRVKNVVMLVMGKLNKKEYKNGDR
jgi:energy-converting hydrogenase Eha subunit C